MNGPLSQLRILDFTWFLAGPFATMVLADLGADVVKVESPAGGDPTRKAGPFQRGASAYFQSVNRGKRSIVLDLKTEKGRELAHQLADQADVLVENFTPGTMQSWGLDYETLSESNPRLIYASCTGFGRNGERARRPAFDVIVQALAGTMSITGQPGQAPTRVGTSIGDLGAALFLVAGILAALQARHISGRGQLVETSLLDAQVALLENAFARYFATGDIPQPQGSRHPLIAPFQAFQSQDGYFVLSTGTEEQWQRLCRALGRTDLLDDPRFSDNALRRQNLDELDLLLSGIFRESPTSMWLEKLEQAEVPCAPIQNIAEASRDPQIAQRNMFVNLIDPEHGVLRFVNTPLRFSETPAGVRQTGPVLGAALDDVLQGWLGDTGNGADLPKEAKES